ncbi:hypothetical protein PHMEG_0005312 [Phytophthora megakarya]|uniref:PH domain-containing protein n=1 Tax=Phytophthora megakarya TaxID=4795 RepID=A0A225WRJ6_9STRA|nr:hypothetical protein PHMEG_0005312 [Phytophthora megakarya]
MSSSAAAESSRVRLKRKVRNAETNLFEWRPCICTIVARSGKLLLQLQTPPGDDDSQDENDGEAEIVTIDLATQLHNVVSKKNKTRCDLEYYTPEDSMSRDILKEELMAPSAAHCQQWIAQIRRVQQQAHEQRRPTSSSSTRSSAPPVAPLPSPLPSQYDGEGESSQAELHILQRVEAALRALELENAQAKAHERELVQEIQTLRDAARVTAAERKHIEHEYRHARREVDSWRRAAQSAEAAAAQLQEQLGIAREESQLLAGEKLRLKRQNNELLTQVHRLDSLVYGRF